MKRIIIIEGSSRGNGDTRRLTKYILENEGWNFVDLRQKRIEHFDYDFKNSSDDFLVLIEEIINNNDILIFATPVYWYSMSGRMKVFFDRITDLLIAHKELGRNLRGKSIGVISCGTDKILKDQFHMPFIETANYLGMKYLSDVHGWVEDDEITKEIQLKLDEFKKEINTAYNKTYKQ